jgi:hypothetical protein
MTLRELDDFLFRATPLELVQRRRVAFMRERV